VNDVKARFEAIALAQSKRLADILRKLGEALSARIAAAKEASRSEPPHLHSKAAKIVSTNLSPLTWLIVAASSAGAIAALVIILGYGFLDKTSAAIAPLKERTATLGKRLDSTESAGAALADRVAATEGAIAKSNGLTNSTIATIQEIQKAVAGQSAQRTPSQGEIANLLSALANLETRVTALEKNQLEPGTPVAEIKPQSLTASTGDGHDETTFPPFDPVNFTSLLVWLTLSFGFLYLLMSKIAVPRVEAILQTRAHNITKDISTANALRAQAEEAAAAHDKTIADAKAKALTLAQETHARLNAETEAKRIALEAELNAKLASSEAQVLDMKAKAMSNVEGIANETAAAIVQHITGKPANQDAIAKAIATIKA
jgi:F-type H+-transporting ATPase subunit b